LWRFAFPYRALNVYPWGISVNGRMPVPGEDERTRFHCYRRVLDEQSNLQCELFWLSDQVDREGVDALAQVLSAMRSGHAPRSRFAPGHEVAPPWFHRLVAEAVRVEPAS
jgi:hypothetical protein